MESGGDLGIKKKKDGETFLKGIVGRITYGTEGLFVPLALALPNPTRKSVRLVPKTVSKKRERSGIPCLPADLPTPAEAGFAKADKFKKSH